jgi:hypothetical protein
LRITVPSSAQAYRSMARDPAAELAGDLPLDAARSLAPWRVTCGLGLVPQQSLILLHRRDESASSLCSALTPAAGEEVGEDSSLILRFLALSEPFFNV